MDKIDEAIIAHLRNDADITNVALADKVNLSPSSCLRRVQRLKQQGIIEKTVCKIKDTALGRTLIAFVEVDLDRHGGQAKDVFQRAVIQEGAVIQAFHITGQSDVFLQLALKDMAEYQDICERLFNQNPNVLRFRTSFALGEIKS